MRPEQLRNLDRALNRWQLWADGHHITSSELDATVDVLESVSGGGPGASACRPLAQAIRTWAAECGIELAQPRRPFPYHMRAQSLSIEMDL